MSSRVSNFIGQEMGFVFFFFWCVKPSSLRVRTSFSFNVGTHPSLFGARFSGVGGSAASGEPACT